MEGEERTAQETANADLDRQAAALEAFNKPDGDAGAAAGASDGKPPEGQKPPESAKPADGQGSDGKPPEGQKPPEVKPGDTTDIKNAPFFNDAAFQAYYKEAEQARTVTAAFRQIFDAGRYEIKDENTLKAVHEDAFLLYDIAAGKQPASALLEVFKKNWTPEQFKTVMQDLANYAANADIIGKKGEPNPLESRLSKLEQEREESLKAERERKTEEGRMKVVDSLIGEITRLCTEKGIIAGDKATPEEKKAIEAEVGDYVEFVTAELGKNPDLVKQLEKGQFGEAQRIFTERHNILTARAKRYADSQIKKFDEKNKKIPNQATGNAGASGAPRPQAGQSTAERALEMFNKQ